MGCIGRLGCLILLVILAAAGWFTRGYWMPKVFGNKAAATAVWEPITDDGTARTQAALDRLALPAGAAFESLSPGDITAYMLNTLAGQMPKSTDSVTAAVIGDRVYVRGSIRPSELGGSELFGSIGSRLKDRERVELSGTLSVVRSELAEFRVESATMGEIPIPRALVPAVLRAVLKRNRPEGVSDRGLPFRIPPSIGDVKVSDGKITLYKAGP